MNPRKTWAYLIFIILGLAALLAGMFWANYRFAAARHNLESFPVYWSGTSALVMHGTSPYATTTEWPGPSRDIPVTFPLYAVFVFLPVTIFPGYTLALAVWMLLLEMALFASLVWALRAIEWPLSGGLFVLLGLVAYTAPTSLGYILTGHISILAAAFFIGAIAALQARREEFSGALLALATIQPLLSPLAILFILLWAISRQKWLLLAWFFGITIGLSVVAIFVIRDWPVQWLRALLHAHDYASPARPADIFMAWWPGIGRKLSWVFSGLLGLGILGEWIAAWGKDWRWFIWTLSLTITAGLWIGLPAGPENYPLLILPLFTALAAVGIRGGPRLNWLVLTLAGFFWAGSWALMLLVPGGQLRTVLYIVPPAFLLALLYWVRWWAIRPLHPFARISRTID